MTGVRLKDKKGNDFILFKMDWFLMRPKKNAEACFRELYLIYNFPFALCSELPDGLWTFYVPDSLEDSVKSIDPKNTKWEKISVRDDPK